MGLRTIETYSVVDLIIEVDAATVDTPNEILVCRENSRTYRKTDIGGGVIKWRTPNLTSADDYLRGGSANITTVGIGASVDFTVTFNSAFPQLAGKTIAESAAMIQVLPIVNGVGTLLGSVAATVKTKTLTNCVVTIKNTGLGILSTGTLEVIAFLNGVLA